MKLRKTIYYVLMFLPCFVTTIALFYLPDQIPAHYDFNNQVTRWGSKYESLLFPVISILFGLFMLVIAKFAAKQEGAGKNNEKICLLAGIAGLIVYNAMTYYALYVDFKKIENLSSVSIDLFQLLFGILGITMIITGNIMPKLRLNSFIGVRTPWSIKNETTWKKSQRFGGAASIFTGFIILLICFLTRGWICFLWSGILIAALLIADIFYSYKIAQKYGTNS